MSAVVDKLLQRGAEANLQKSDAHRRIVDQQHMGYRTNWDRISLD